MENVCVVNVNVNPTITENTAIFAKTVDLLTVLSILIVYNVYTRSMMM